MNFLSGIAVGAAVGYVMGAKAGREQYDRIVAVTGAALQNEALNRHVDVNKVKGAIGSGMATASEAIRRAAD
jgi:hypothetical protein